MVLRRDAYRLDYSSVSKWLDRCHTRLRLASDYFVTPTVKFRLEDHEAGPMPRLIKERRARGLAPPRKAGCTWRWAPAKEETDWSFVHISFP